MAARLANAVPISRDWLGQLHKSPASDVLAYWYLPLMALAGGQAGNLMALNWLGGRTIALLTSLLVLFVAGQLGLRTWIG